jgi:hypothetical protein
MYRSEGLTIFTDPFEKQDNRITVFFGFVNAFVFAMCLVSCIFSFFCGFSSPELSKHNWVVTTTTFEPPIYIFGVSGFVTADFFSYDAYGDFGYNNNDGPLKFTSYTECKGNSTLSFCDTCSETGQSVQTLWNCSGVLFIVAIVLHLGVYACGETGLGFGYKTPVMWVRERLGFKVCVMFLSAMLAMSAKIAFAPCLRELVDFDEEYDTHGEYEGEYISGESVEQSLFVIILGLLGVLVGAFHFYHHGYLYSINYMEVKRRIETERLERSQEMHSNPIHR